MEHLPPDQLCACLSPLCTKLTRKDVAPVCRGAVCENVYKTEDWRLLLFLKYLSAVFRIFSNTQIKRGRVERKILLPTFTFFFILTVVCRNGAPNSALQWCLSDGI